MTITFATRDRWILPPNVRVLVLQRCINMHNVQYALHTAVVMPDHVHLLLTPLKDANGGTYALSQIVGGIKGASSHDINRMLGRSGRVWQSERFDRVLRTEERVRTQAEYICANPVRAGLAANEDDYPWLWREWVEGSDDA